MKCTLCKQNEITNKHFKLCFKCNSERLKANKKTNTYNNPIKKRKPLKSSKKKPKNIKQIEFLKKCFEKSDNKCEECSANLSTDFLSCDGKIIDIHRYSHIVPKSVSEKLRYETDNINHLCLKCHQKWEFGNKEDMKIYVKNKAKYPSYFK